MATNMYNPDGGISAIWLLEKQMETIKEQTRRRTIESVKSINYRHNDYEEAFNFLKQHTTTLTDEEIALEVIRSMS